MTAPAMRPARTPENRSLSRIFDAYGDVVDGDIANPGEPSPPLGQLVKEWFGIKPITANRTWWAEQSRDDRLVRLLVLRLSLPPLVIACALGGALGLVFGSSRALTSSVIAMVLGVAFLVLTTVPVRGVARYRFRIDALLTRSIRRRGD